MIPRLAEPRISDLLTRFPAVAVLGPRQVGKTTLARRLVEELGAGTVYLDLKQPSHRAKPTPEDNRQGVGGRFFHAAASKA